MKIITSVLIIWCSALVSAQVKVTIPRAHYVAHDRIEVEILNSGAKDVSFCVQYGYMSFNGDHSELTPTPVYVQQKSQRGWNTLITGPDVGNILVPETLAPGQSRNYPFRVNAHGVVRILVDYWPSAKIDSCRTIKGQKTAKSREFSIE